MQKGKKVPAFIRNTYQMLERSDVGEVVSWSEDGRGFIIKQVDVFSQQILPQYFKHKNYSSFVRQLNMYGFHKQRQHLNYHFFVHEHFRRGVLEEGGRSKIQIDIKRKPEKKKKMAEKDKPAEQNVGRSSDCEQDEMRSVSIVMQDSKELFKKQLEARLEEVNEDVHKDSQTRKNKDVENSILNPGSENESRNRGQFSQERQDLDMGLEKDTLEDILIQQNELLRDVHERLRGDVLNLKKITIKQYEGKREEVAEEKSQLIKRLIASLKEKTAEINQLYSSETCYNE